jgi:Uma2 family endonuclease
MATAPNLPAVSEEEYLRTEYEPNCEYVEGVLVPKPLPDRIHSRLQALITAYLLSVEAKFGFETATEIHTRIARGRWRVPDVAVLPPAADDQRYPNADAPPLLTIEVVSLAEPWAELRGKVTDHLSMGVGTVIVADPHTRTVLVATQSQPLREIEPPLVVTVPVPGRDSLSIDFDALFSQSLKSGG